MDGNDANHAMKGHEGQAITLLRHARKIAVWYFRAYVDGNRKLGSFVPPMATADTGDEAKEEIEKYKALYEAAEAEKRKLEGIAADEAELRRLAEEDREKAFEEQNAALELAEETEEARAKDAERIEALTVQLTAQLEKQSETVSLSQSQRYSESYQLSADEISPGGPWTHVNRRYQIPFLYSTNGRDYLKQLRTKSGIWFHDVRHTTNLPDAKDGWHSPEDLRQMLNTDIAAAEQKLNNSPADYLPLRPYQREALEAVENSLAEGHREMLIAMATGTGKTRTCIAMCYRLIKARRFRRILFLVDRTSLGEQTGDSLDDLKIDNNQTFSDIYDVKALGDVEPDEDTKFQIATIQSMVKRVLLEDGSARPTVGQYDCIVATAVTTLIRSSPKPNSRSETRQTISRSTLVFSTTSMR